MVVLDSAPIMRDSGTVSVEAATPIILSRVIVSVVVCIPPLRESIECR